MRKSVMPGGWALSGRGSTITALGVWAGRAVRGPRGMSAAWAEAAMDKMVAASRTDAMRMMGIPFRRGEFNRKNGAPSPGGGEGAKMRRLHGWAGIHHAPRICLIANGP